MVLDAHAGPRLSPRAVATACLVRRGRGRLSAPCPGDRLSADALRHVLPARAADNQTHGSSRRPVIRSGAALQHLVYPQLVFFRSPRSNNHWVLASEAVLDGAALLLTACDVPRASRGQLCLHAGIHALLSIADFLAIPHRPPEPGAEILLPEEKFNEAFSHLQSIGEASRGCGRGLISVRTQETIRQIRRLIGPLGATFTGKSRHVCPVAGIPGPSMQMVLGWC